MKGNIIDYELSEYLKIRITNNDDSLMLWKTMAMHLYTTKDLKSKGFDWLYFYEFATKRKRIIKKLINRL